MTAGETLLKITDYPFSYSITVIIFIWMGVNVQETKLIGELGVAGALGTFLTVVDPLGRLLRSNLKRYFTKLHENGKSTEIQREYRIRAIKTKSIGIEIDKIVGLVYFSFILFLFAIVLVSSTTFAFDISPKDKDEKPIWNPLFLKIWGPVGSVIVMSILVIVSDRNWKEITNHVATVGTYEFGISSPYATRETIGSMSDALDQNDWPTAEEWEKIVEHEIGIKKAKKDDIVKQAELIYEPLYQESLQIESSIKSISINKMMPTFSYAEWEKIKSSPSYLNMQDLQLKDQIEKFYDVIKEYQNSWNIANNRCVEIIRNVASDFYGFPVDEIRCIIKTKNGERGLPELQHLLFTMTNPLEYYHPEKSTLSSIDIRKRDGNNIRVDSANELTSFDAMWNSMISRAMQDGDISKARNLFEEIKKQSPDIKVKLMGKIKEKWEI